MMSEEIIDPKDTKRNVEKWVQFSTTPRTYEEIVEEYFEEAEIRRKNEYICYTFIFKYSKFSEDDIERLGVISSGILDHEWETCYIDEIRYQVYRKKNFSIITAQSNKDPEDKKKYNLKNFKDKIDWRNVVEFQKLSIPFIKRHRDDMTPSDVYQYQRISRKLLKSIYGNKVDTIDKGEFQPMTQ